MLTSYKASLTELNKLISKKAREPQTLDSKHDLPLLRSMSDSTRYAIEYITLGHAPGSRRGAHRRSREQLEILMDPTSPYFLRQTIGQTIPTQISHDQQLQLDKALATLTDKELQAYELIKGKGFSYREAAELLQLSRGSVQTMIIRAEKKIKANVYKYF